MVPLGNMDVTLLNPIPHPQLMGFFFPLLTNLPHCHQNPETKLTDPREVRKATALPAALCAWGGNHCFHCVPPGAIKHMGFIHVNMDS